MKNSFSSGCARGLHRGNKLYEGHRMMLSEHKDKVIESKRRDYWQAEKEFVVQEEEEQEQIVRLAIETKCMVEICWREIINPIKLSSEQYAMYLHKVFDPNVVREEEIRKEQGRIVGIFAAEGILKCSFNSQNYVVAIQSIIYIKEVANSF